MKEATILFGIGMVACLVGTEVAREIVDSKRRRKTGVGGTQDIHLIGMILTGICLAGVMICGARWLI